jgi:hypothetical protein
VEPEHDKVTNMKNPYAEFNGKFYVRSDHSGIHPLMLLVGGPPQMRFGKRRKNTYMYIDIDDAIAWHEQFKTTGVKRDIKEALIRARDRFIASPGEGVRA